jgi:uncharacterized protein (TIGR02996 family)
MSTDGDALLRAICEHPWEDTPRLVYADWLDENGQPERAAYIRLAVAMEERLRQRRTIAPAQSERFGALREVEGEWLKELPKLRGVAWDTGFERGFPARVNTSSASAFLNNAEQIYRFAPVTWVKIQTVSAKTVNELPRSPYLARLSGLDLRTCRLGDRGVRELCSSPHLSRLGVLNLCRVGMTDDGVTALANCRGLGSLWALWLDGNPISDAAARVLAGSPHFPNLVGVYYHQTRITAEGGAMLDRMAAENEKKLPEWTTDPNE